MSSLYVFSSCFLAASSLLLVPAPLRAKLLPLLRRAR
jgi:hypothetical protein